MIELFHNYVYSCCFFLVISGRDESGLFNSIYKKKSEVELNFRSSLSVPSDIFIITLHLDST